MGRALAEEHHVPIVERWWRDIFVQALAGVSFMHKHCIMHCDIKEANIMVANAVHTQEAIRKPHIVMIDFGMVPAWRHVVNGYHDVAAHARFEEGHSSRR